MLNQIPEIQVAVKFIASCLYGKLPRRRADLFAEELSSAIQTKFQGHWYADQPAKGSGFRCLHFTSKEVDPVFHKAAEASGLAFTEISAHIPAELSVWVDPGEVSYQIGEKGTVSILYKRNYMGQEEFGHDVSSNQAEILNGSEQKLYTVAEFMSTKFGSTKNRGQRAQQQAAQQQQQRIHQQQQSPQPLQQQQQINFQQQFQQQLQQSQNLIRHQMQAMNQAKMQPSFAQQQAFLQQQILIQKLAMQNLQQMNQKAYGMQNLKQTSKTPQSPFNSRWNENGNMVHQKQPVQPELQLNMNSQGGFVPQFINHNRSESIPSPIQSDSSIQSSTWSSSSVSKDCWSVNQSLDKKRWSPDNVSNSDWSSCDDSGITSNDDDLDLDPEIFQQIAALRIES